MTTVNRLKNKKKSTQPQGTSADTEPATVSSPLKQSHERRTKVYNVDNHSAQRQKQYESYYEISQCNPIGVTATSTLFPHSQQMASHYNVPMGFTVSPTLFTQNQNAQVMQKSADRIPRCGCCRAYMNCYNKIDKKRFTCFLCNRQNQLDKDYLPNQAPNDELNSSIYQAIGPTNFYATQPTQQTFVFFIDINSDAAHTRMLYYAVAAMKEVLARPELDDICVYFYTYDQFIQEYDFSGEDIKCTIVDQTIEGQLGLRLQACFLKDIRDKIFEILDALQDISQNNNRKGSNFVKCFNYVFHALKHTEPKFFILQCNQAINGQQIFWEELAKNKQGTQPSPAGNRSQSLFETQNKTFFSTYVEEMLKYDCSLSFFSFSRNFRNYRTIHDTMKLTNSEIKLYNKDSQVDLDKFYYDFSFLLGVTYFKKVRAQFVVSQGWYFTAIYGNFYRIKQYIIFQIPNVENSRKILVLLCPSKNTQTNPYCSIQIITNYRYKRQNFMCVSTIVQPLTGHLQRLYASIDPTVVITALARGFMSSLRMQSVNNARKKLIDAASLIYISALQTYKKTENIPDTIMTTLMAALAMLKSAHSQPQLINNTPTLDKIVGERNYLQFCGHQQMSAFFSPYLFDLSSMDQSMCRQDIEFAYPPTIEAKFHNTREGLFLLDNGLAMYLFVAKTCDPSLLKDVFGQSKLSRNDILNQQLLNQQTSFRALQVQTLVKFLRQQKSFGWIPLYVVRCGQNTLNQRNFYLQFYPQKYEEFRNYKLNLEQFLAMLSRPNSF